MKKKNKFFEKEDFKDLQKKWYQALEDDGFSDQEDFVGDELLLTEYGHRFSRRRVSAYNDQRLEYYLRLEQAVALEDFTSPRDQIIMQSRAQGLRIFEIRKLLIEKGFSTNRNLIRYIIRRYEHKWKIRRWKKTQMNPNLIAS